MTLTVFTEPLTNQVGLEHDHALVTLLTPDEARTLAMHLVAMANQLQPNQSQVTKKRGRPRGHRQLPNLRELQKALPTERELLLRLDEYIKNHLPMILERFAMFPETPLPRAYVRLKPKGPGSIHSLVYDTKWRQYSTTIHKEIFDSWK